MKRKDVSVSIQGQRYPVKGWGLPALPGLSLTAIYGLVEGKPEVFDKKTIVLVHDLSGEIVVRFQGGIKAFGEEIARWNGGGVDWTKSKKQLLVEEDWRPALGALAFQVYGEKL